MYNSNDNPTNYDILLLFFGVINGIIFQLNVVKNIYFSIIIYFFFSFKFLYEEIRKKVNIIIQISIWTANYINIYNVGET